MTLSSTEIQVNWTDVPEIDQNGIITEYEVMYEPLMSFGGALSTEAVITTNVSIVLGGLEEHVEYNISVRAFTSVGPGPFSSIEMAMTEENSKFIVCMLYSNFMKCVLQILPVSLRI